MHAGNGMQVLSVEPVEVQIARLEVTQANHERRITQIEVLVWKVFVAALGGAVAGGGAVTALARLFWAGS